MTHEKPQEKKEIKLFGPTFWIHLPLVILANVSFILVSWYWILFWAGILFLQYWMFSGCILTNKQFGSNNDLTFYTIYLEKLGFRFNRKRFRFYMRYIHPFMLALIAFLLQQSFPALFPLWF